MSFLGLILRNSLFYGAILSVFLSILILASLAYNAEMWVGDYPPGIKEKFGPISKKAKRQLIFLSFPFFLALAAAIIFSNLHLRGFIAGDLGFWMYFLNTFIVVETFNLVDLLILDGLVFVVIQPKFAILPGTEGMREYNDFGFHVRGFGIGTIMSLVAAAITAGIGLGLQSIF